MTTKKLFEFFDGVAESLKETFGNSPFVCFCDYVSKNRFKISFAGKTESIFDSVNLSIIIDVEYGLPKAEIQCSLTKDDKYVSCKDIGYELPKYFSCSDDVCCEITRLIDICKTK